jgi:cephalosporin-C deacetylase-like acetyl esterase
MREEGFSKLGICGMSMGGVHAAMVGALHPHALAVTPIMVRLPRAGPSPHASSFVIERWGLLGFSVS